MMPTVNEDLATGNEPPFPPCTLSITVEHLFRDEILGYLDRKSVVIMMEALPDNDRQFHLRDHFCFLHGTRFAVTGFLTNDEDLLGASMDEEDKENNQHVGCSKAEKESPENHQLTSEFIKNHVQMINDVQIMPTNKESLGYSEEETQLYTQWMKNNPVCHPSKCTDCHMIGHHDKERCEDCDQFKNWNTIKTCDVCGEGRCCTDCSYWHGTIVECEFCEQNYCFKCFGRLDIPFKCSGCERIIDHPYIIHDDIVVVAECGFQDTAVAADSNDEIRAPSSDIQCW